MSEAVATHAEAFETPLTPESWGKLGMWIFLVGDAMSFGTLLAGYGAVRFGSGDWPHPSAVLGINLTAFMTFLLICSSVTMVKGLSAAQHDDQAGFRKYIGLTILGGVIFLGLQAYEWTHLIHEAWGSPAGNMWGSTNRGLALWHDLFRHYGFPWHARDGRRHLLAMHSDQRLGRSIQLTELRPPWRF